MEFVEDKPAASVGVVGGSDFSNPMFGNMPSTSSSGGGNAAVITPTVLSGGGPGKQFSINEDTGKDTQNLITEAGSSEC